MFSVSKLAILAFFTTQLSALTHGLPVLEQRSPPLSLGLANTFGAIAATTLTSTGLTVITGNAGTYPGTAITGFGAGAGVVTGSIDAGNGAAQGAEAGALTAYNNGVGLVPTKALPVTDLGGLTLPPGVYTFPTLNAALSTTLTLNGTSNPTGQFVFQIRTTFATSAATSKITLIGGAKAYNVYFLVGSSATIGGGSKLQGNFVAYTSIAVGSGASINGTLGALNGGITLIADHITAQPS